MRPTVGPAGLTYTPLSLLVRAPLQRADDLSRVRCFATRLHEKVEASAAGDPETAKRITATMQALTAHGISRWTAARRVLDSPAGVKGVLRALSAPGPSLALPAQCPPVPTDAGLLGTEAIPARFFPRDVSGETTLSNVVLDPRNKGLLISELFRALAAYQFELCSAGCEPREYVRRLHRYFYRREACNFEVEGWSRASANPSDLALGITQMPDAMAAFARFAFENYLGRTPSPEEVSALVARISVFQSTGRPTDYRSVLADILASPEFFAGGACDAATANR